MIGFLKGQILENDEGRLIVLVSEGVGYSVMTPLSPSYVGMQTGATVELHVYTHVLETALDLYGFASRAEKDIFLSLISVNGLGPKKAISILSQVNPGDLVQAIARGDKKYLSAIKGVGGKTAEQLVLDLADKLRLKIDSGTYGGARVSRPAGAELAPMSSLDSDELSIVRDAREALLGLGFREQEVAPVINRVLAESNPAPKRAEDLVRHALKALS